MFVWWGGSKRGSDGIMFLMGSGDSGGGGAITSSDWGKSAMGIINFFNLQPKGNFTGEIPGGSKGNSGDCIDISNPTTYFSSSFITTPFPSVPELTPTSPLFTITSTPDLTPPLPRFTL